MDNIVSTEDEYFSLDISPDAIIVAQEDGTIVHCNMAMELLFGYSKDEMLEKKVEMLIPERFRSQHVTYRKNYMRSLGEYCLQDMREVAGLHKNGTEIAVDIKLAPFTFKGRNLVCASIRDATLRKERQDALRKSDERYQVILDTMNEAFGQVDHDYIFQYVNEKFSRLLGYTKEELLGKPLLDFIHEDDKKKMSKQMELRKKGGEKSFELAWNSKSGDKIYTLASPKASYDEQGRFLGSFGVLTDITELQRQHQILVESEDQYQTLIETIPYGIQENDLTGKIIISNKAHSDMHGYKHGELLGKYIWDLTNNEEERDRIRNYFKSLLDEKPRPTPFFTKDITKQGDEIDTQVDWNYRYNSENQLSGLVSVITDITDQIKTKNALKQSEENYRKVVEDQTEYIVRWLPDGTRTFVNDSYCRCFGKRREELVGSTFWDLITEEDRESVYNRIHALTPENPVSTGVHRYIAGDGSTVWQQWTDRALFDKDGELTHLQSVGRDITELKTVEEQRDRFFEMSLDMLCIADFDGYFIDLSKAWTKILGFSVEELKAKPFIEFIHPDDHEKTISESNRLHADSTVTIAFINRYLHKDGSYRWLQWNAKSYPERRQIFCVVQDITEIKKVRDELQHAHDNLEQRVEDRTRTLTNEIAERQRIEIELRQAKEAADFSNQAKSDFLSNMSHELRTPLNAILGFSQILEHEQNISVNQRDFATEIHTAGDHLLELIDEVLDLAKIESGQLDISVKPVSIKDVFDDCEALIHPFAESHNLQLIISTGSCNDMHVMADYIRLKQVLLNLLSNAVKYNLEGGSVEMSCSEVADEKIRITVHDTGVGLTPQQQQQLFQPFSRLGAEYSEIEGTGLGLVISKRIIDCMGGSIDVESRLGQGTSFWVQLPKANAEITRISKSRIIPNIKKIGSVPSIDEARAVGQLVLVAEDDDVNRNMIVMHLNLLGYAAEAVASGSAAFKSWLSGSYGMVLTDLRMPYMDGFQLADEIRIAERGSALHTPIIVITADVFKGDIGFCRDHDIDDLLIKPVKLDELQNILTKWLPKKTIPTH